MQGDECDLHEQENPSPSNGGVHVQVYEDMVIPSRSHTALASQGELKHGSGSTIAVRVNTIRDCDTPLGKSLST